MEPWQLCLAIAAILAQVLPLVLDARVFFFPNFSVQSWSENQRVNPLHYIKYIKP